MVIIETNRQRDRQEQIEKYDRHRDKPYSETDREIDIKTDRELDRNIDTETKRQSDR